MSIMTALESRALVEFPELRHLAALRRSGWKFKAVRRDGRMAAIDGWRDAGHGFTDGICVSGPREVGGIRTDPVGAVVWEFGGDVAEVVAALRALPPPGHRLAPRLVVTSSLEMLWTP